MQVRTRRVRALRCQGRLNGLRERLAFGFTGGSTGSGIAAGSAFSLIGSAVLAPAARAADATADGLAERAKTGATASRLGGLADESDADAEEHGYAEDDPDEEDRRMGKKRCQPILGASDQRLGDEAREGHSRVRTRGNRKVPAPDPISSDFVSAPSRTASS